MITLAQNVKHPCQVLIQWQDNQKHVLIVKILSSEELFFAQVEQSPIRLSPKRISPTAKLREQNRKTNIKKFLIRGIIPIILMGLFLSIVSGALPSLFMKQDVSSKTIKDATIDDIKILKDFATISLQIRTGLSEGISYKDYTDKYIKLRDAYALVQNEQLPIGFNSKIFETFGRVKLLGMAWESKIELDVKYGEGSYEKEFRESIDEAVKALDSFLADYNQVKNK